MDIEIKPRIYVVSAVTIETVGTRLAGARSRCVDALDERVQRTSAVVQLTFVDIRARETVARVA